MIQPIVRDVMFLSCKSQMATAEDLPVARDLADTLRAHAHECVGMAANMIGIRKRIIAVMAGKTVLAQPGHHGSPDSFRSAGGVLVAGRRAPVFAVSADFDGISG